MWTRCATFGSNVNLWFICGLLKLWPQTSDLGDWAGLSLTSKANLHCVLGCLHELGSVHFVHDACPAQTSISVVSTCFFCLYLFVQISALYWYLLVADIRVEVTADSWQIYLAVAASYCWGQELQHVSHQVGWASFANRYDLTQTEIFWAIW